MISNTTLLSGPYLTDGHTVGFPVTFKFLASTDLLVLLVAATGTITTLALTTDYTVAGAGVENGGTVTTVATYASGSSIVILRNMAMIQDSDIENQGTFYPDVVEGSFDYVTLLVQQLAEQLGRCFKTPPGTQPVAYTPVSGVVSNVVTFPIQHPTLAGCQIQVVADGWAFQFNGVTVLHITKDGIVP